MIIVLKTNIFSQLETQVRAILDCFNQISTVDFDFEDVDNILRIQPIPVGVCKVYYDDMILYKKESR